MKPGKATFDLLKVVGDPVPKELKRNFNGILHEVLCLEEGTTSLTLLLYKNKGDPLSCCNYRGLTLRSWNEDLGERISSQVGSIIQHTQLAIRIHAWKIHYECYILSEACPGSVYD